MADAGGTALTNHTCKRAGRAHFSVGCVFTHEGVKKRDEEWLINAVLQASHVQVSTSVVRYFLLSTYFLPTVLQGGVPPEDVPPPADAPEGGAEAKEEGAAAGDESDEDGGDGNSEEF